MTLRCLRPVAALILLCAAPATAGEYPWWNQRNSPVSILYGRVAMSMVRVNWTGERGKDEFQVDQLGIIVGADGLILTPGHIRRPAFTTTSITVYFSATATAKAEFVGKDTELDVAFIRAPLPQDGTALPLDLTRTQVLAPGDGALMFTLLGGGFRFQPAVERTDIVATADTPVPHYVMNRHVASFNAFAPIFTARGMLVGFAIPGSGAGVLSRPGGGDMALGIPVQKMLPLFANPPVEREERTRRQGWLGIVMQAMPEELAEYWSLARPGGIIVSQVLENSPAAAAGLRTGDIIVGFNGDEVPVNSEEDLAIFTRMVKTTPLDAPVPVEIYRARNLQTLTVTLGPRPVDQMYQKQYVNPLFGLTAKELDVGERVALGLPESVRGILVLQVAEGSWGALSALSAGDIVTRIDGRDIGDLTTFEETLERAATERPQRLLVLVRRGVRTEFIAIKPQWDLVPPTEE